MPAPNTHARQVVREAIQERLDAGETVLKRTLARKLYAQYPELWASMNACRSMIQAVTGAMGNSGRRKYKVEFDIPHGSHSDRPWKKLPDGMKDFDDWSPFQMTPGTWLAIGDTHCPYHSVEAIECALETGLKHNVTGVAIMGDHVDCYALSRWETDPRIRNFPRELEVARAVLDSIASAFPGAEKVWKPGNHDERFEKYMMKKAPELLGVPGFDLPSMLRLEETGWTEVPDNRVMRFGKLNAIHGHEFGASFTSPVNPARGLFNKGKAHAICWHYHRTSQHSETDMEGHTTTTYSVGMCCDGRPKYRPMNKWNPGHCIIHCAEDGSFEVDNYRVVNGKAYR